MRKHTWCFSVGEIFTLVYLFKISSDVTGHVMFEVNLELIPQETGESAFSSKAPAWEGSCPGENLDSRQGDKQKLKVEKKETKLQSSNPTDEAKPERKKQSHLRLETHWYPREMARTSLPFSKFWILRLQLPSLKYHPKILNGKV